MVLQKTARDPAHVPVPAAVPGSGQPLPEGVSFDLPV